MILIEHGCILGTSKLRQFFHHHKISNLYKAMFVKSKLKVHSSRLFHMDIFHVYQTSKKSQDIFSTWQNVELMKHFSLSQKVDIVK